jgi:hypothetical protein
MMRKLTSRRDAILLPGFGRPKESVCRSHFIWTELAAELQMLWRSFFHREVLAFMTKITGNRAGVLALALMLSFALAAVCPAQTSSSSQGASPRKASSAAAKQAGDASAVSARSGDVGKMTCGELLFKLGDESQLDDSTYLLLWAYGVKAGASGGDLAKNPLTEAGLKAFVGALYDTCKVKSDVLLMDVLLGRAGK